MLALAEISPWYWGAFIVCVLIFLALDLGVFHREPREVKYKEALVWTILWFSLAVLFAGGLALLRSRKEAVEFFTGYFIELSLSMDNVFIIALIFTFFRVPVLYQHRVLFWGILGALVMRGMMIWVGVELISRFEWVLYVFGAFIVITGLKMLFGKDTGVDPETSFVVSGVRKLFPVAPDFDGQKFFTWANGRRAMTPLFLVLLLVETTDLLFAVDSIPAIFGVTRRSFIVFTSNVFAILGLRTLYFILAGAIGLFRFLKTGLSIVLVFIGAKMLLDPHDDPPRWFQVDIPDSLALVVVVLIIGVSIVASKLVAERKPASGGGSGA
ncbi:MAG TPA: TerC family protein [Verrucomicrobiae bacterium]|jgi:tellurite resistance protein TerC|nr:TerC family protein [Verrucomicrobiae bacterium]